MSFKQADQITEDEYEQLDKLHYKVENELLNWIQFVAQYKRWIRPVAFENIRITYYEGKIVRFSYRDYAEGGKTSFLTLKVQTFIGRLIRLNP